MNSPRYTARAAQTNGAPDIRETANGTDGWAVKARQLAKDISSISNDSYYFINRKASAPSSADQLQDYFAEVANHIHPRVTAGVLAHKYNLQAMITAGSHTVWQDNARRMMETIITIGRDAEEAGLHQELAAQILSADYAVFQLARQGQARAAWREISAFTPRNTARVFDAEMALFGLLQHLPTQKEKGEVLAVFAALKPDVRARLADPQSERINVRQNYYYLRDSGFDFEAAQNKADTPIKFAPRTETAPDLHLAYM